MQKFKNYEKIKDSKITNKNDFKILLQYYLIRVFETSLM